MPLITSFNNQCICAGFPELEQLRSMARKQLSMAHRPGTAKNLKGQQKLYLAFCEHFGFDPHPPTQDTVSLLITFYTHTFKAHQTLLNYISGVRSYLKNIGVTAPSLTSHHTKLMIRASKLIMSKSVKRATPITAEMLSDLCSTSVTLFPTLHPILRVAMLFSWFGLLRASNIAPPQWVSSPLATTPAGLTFSPLHKELFSF